MPQAAEGIGASRGRQEIQVVGFPVTIQVICVITRIG
jgi:hypothetical protein